MLKLTVFEKEKKILAILLRKIIAIKKKRICSNCLSHQNKWEMFILYRFLTLKVHLHVFGLKFK